ncbi:DNA polymerase III subunit gamma/tau [Paracidobacterium acidisoli]|uniref:DNA polymerase III subunit gamma/tau n=1 Tax=Paracidobacterium acidisoli TaxID=2303751 RepID=A0A372ISX9_9BACT|nr:DNA polymerase III subunit gamma/tau [Paracidobacterium acidisoli]MBT9329465.1 DNA polymerase III subunit gamma/tau [Paracidobacterium acidisoli]
MTYQVLARKYRPQRFSDVAGQEHVTRTLLNALAQGRIAHGYIFSGHRGIGKTTIARILAQALNCRTEIGSAQRPTPEPCGVCDSCTEIRAGNAVDVIEIDAATNRGIDEIRELRDAARYRPARDKYKIYILDEAHQITDAAFNALLKTLEEPPDHVVFMMATTQPEDFPQTIRSRCQHFSFHAVKFDDILAQLRGIASQENIEAEDGALALLAEAGDGSMRDALSIMDQAIASAPLEDGRPHLDAEQIRELMGAVPNAIFERLLEAIGEGQSPTVIEEMNRLLNAGNSPSALARQFVRYLRNVLMARIAGENSDLLQVSADERARAGRSAALFSEEDLTRFLQVMLRTFDDLNYRQEQRFHLELGLVRLVHLQRLLPVEEFLSMLPVSSDTGKAGGGQLSAASSARPATQRAIPPPVRTATAAPVRAPERAPEPAKPAFSPFEADRSRKITGESTVPAMEETAPPETRIIAPEPHAVTAFQTVAEPAVVSELRAAPEPRALTPMEATARAVASVPARPPVPAGMAEITDGALALAIEPGAAAENPDLARITEAVCAALEREGHNTAAVLLGDGTWTQQGETIQVEVAIRKTMLGLTMNAEAEKICRSAMREIGASQKLVVVPGENGSGKASKPRAAVSGSVQAAALDNPLVKQAQELFSAEVRSVLDLRDKN